MQTLSPSLLDESGPLPRFTMDSSDLEDVDDLIDVEEPDELTIRRIFEPKRPARVAVEISDADATWKWERPTADAQGQFVGLAIPILEDARALEFDHSEVEVTREMMSPFALTPVASAIPLARARRRPRVVRAKTAPRSFLRRNFRRATLVACAALAAFAIAFVLGRPSQTFSIGISAGVANVATPIDLPPVADVPLQGTIIPSVKGHRLYVDGKLIGDSDGPVKVDCGTRIVKLGTAGVTKSIAVPCGGEIAIAP